MGVSGHHVPVWYDESTGPARPGWSERLDALETEVRRSRRERRVPARNDEKKETA